MRLFTPLRTLSTRRAFSTSRVLRLELSYQVFEPDAKAKAGPEGDPIVFLHGLFGSKTNNRSISKYVFNLTPESVSYTSIHLYNIQSNTTTGFLHVT